MTRKSKKSFDIDPNTVKSEIVEVHSFTLLSHDVDAAQIAAIGSASDPAEKTKLASRRIIMHIENASTILTFLKARGGAFEKGCLVRPHHQLAELRKLKSEIEQAIRVFTTIDWPAD